MLCARRLHTYRRHCSYKCHKPSFRTYRKHGKCMCRKLACMRHSLSSTAASGILRICSWCTSPTTRKGLAPCICSTDIGKMPWRSRNHSSFRTRTGHMRNIPSGSCMPSAPSGSCIRIALAYSCIFSFLACNCRHSARFVRNTPPAARTRRKPRR